MAFCRSVEVKNSTASIWPTIQHKPLGDFSCYMSAQWRTSGRTVFGPSGQRDSGPAMGRLQFRESLGAGSEKRGGRQGGRCEDGIFKGRCSARCSSGRGAVKLARCFILPARHRLGFCQSGNGKAVPPGELAEKAAPAGCEAGRTGRRHRVAHIPPYLSLLARRNGCSDEGATGTDASRLDPDDDERLRAGHDGNQTPCEQSGCGTGVRLKLAAFA